MEIASCWLFHLTIIVRKEVKENATPSKLCERKRTGWSSPKRQGRIEAKGSSISFPSSSRWEERTYMRTMHTHGEARYEGWRSNNEKSWLLLFLPSANGLGASQHMYGFLSSTSVSSSQRTNAKCPLMLWRWHSDSFPETVSFYIIIISTHPVPTGYCSILR